MRWRDALSWGILWGEGLVLSPGLDHCPPKCLYSLTSLHFALCRAALGKEVPGGPQVCGAQGETR